MVKPKEFMKIFFIISVMVILPMVVFADDMATEHTQLLNYAELIMENLRQPQGLENQVQMIQNQVQELKSVDNYQNNFSDVDGLRNNLTSITAQGTSLSNQTQSILSQMQQILSTMPASGTMIDQQESLDQGVLNIIQTALNRVAQFRQSYQQANQSLNTLMDKNNNSVGQTQALQTSNELAAQNITQNQSTQELLSEQITLQAAMMSKQLQEQQDEDNKMKQIFNADDDGSSIIQDNESQ